MCEKEEKFAQSSGVPPGGSPPGGSPLGHFFPGIAVAVEQSSFQGQAAAAATAGDPETKSGQTFAFCSRRK